MTGRRLSNALSYLIGLSILGLMILFAADEPAAKETLELTIVGIHQFQSEDPQPPVLIAELSSGSKVFLRGSQRAARKIGSTALVQRYETSILGRTHYRFVKYLN